MHSSFIITLLVVTAYLASAGPVCPPGTDRYYNQDINKEVCCKDIQCDSGEQPEPCNLTSSTSSCLPCPKGTYQPQRRSLSDRTYRNCRMKTPCDSYIDKGAPDRDAKCNCPQDQWLSGDGICLPRPSCPPGFGQTPAGYCERCTEGKTYSDEHSNTANCKVVTNCQALGRCMLTTATIESDSECGPKTTDLRLCQVSSKPTKSTEPYDHSTTGPTEPMSTKPKTLSIDNTTIAIIVSVVLFVCVVIVVLLAVHFIRRRHKKNLDIETLHVNYAIKISKLADVQVRPIKENVFKIVEDSLAETAPGQWESLGRILLGKDFDEKRDDIIVKDIPESEKMREMLLEWRERCQTHGPDLEFLFKSMYSKKTRKSYKFNSVIDDIKKEYGTTIGVADNMTLRNKNNRSKGVPLVECLQCHDGDGSEYINSSEELLGGKDQDEVKTPVRCSENLLCGTDLPSHAEYVSTV